MENAKSNGTFCFADGVEVKAIKAVKFPVTLGSIKGVRAYIEADIIKNHLLSLLSHKSMKTDGMVLNFENDSCQILCSYIKLQRTTAGLYSLPMTNTVLGAEISPKMVLHYKALEKCSQMEKRSKHEKFHWLWKERLISLVRGSLVFYD